MRAVPTVSLGAMVALAASLLLARVHPFGDAGLHAAQGSETPVLTGGQFPQSVGALLVEKCADCHSNRTHAPLYGRFAPASWLMERDIVEARKAMNLSQWDGYSPDQRQTFAAKIVQETKSRRMPLPQYRLIHWNARISDADVATLNGWARAESGAGAEEQVAGTGDPMRGKALFEKRCTGCHALTKNMEGPQLQGVFGRTSGTAPGFAYSAALKKAGIVWDESSLDKWLSDPDAFIAGNEMDFSIANAQERLDLIKYLRLSLGK